MAATDLELAEVTPAAEDVGPVGTDRRTTRRARFGLRARIVLAFVLGALLLSGLLATVAYTLTRNNLLEVRETTGVGIAGNNASAVRQALNVEEGDIELTLASLSTPTGSFPIVRVGGEWVSANPLQFAETDVDPTLLAEVESGTPSEMRYRVGPAPYLVIGIPLVEVDAVYLEAVPLRDIDDTLQSLALALAGGAAITAIAGAALGWWAARRVLLPLEEIGEAAEAIANGELDTRLEAETDRDLGRLTASFNTMAGSLEQRIETDARFASEVSHELRSPLMTLTASLEVLRNQQDGMTPRARTALELLSTDLDRFQQLVEDLLEMSRFDVGMQALQPSRFELTEFVRQAVAAAGESTEVIHGPEVEGLMIEADKRRLARVIANLLDNASKYGGGATGVEIGRRGSGVEIAVVDAGPGIPEAEREAIFGRFNRGIEGGRRGAGTGVGLGLALVTEHIRLHGGSVEVQARPDGETGSRFVVILPEVIV